MTQLPILTAVLKSVLWLWILHSSMHNTQDIELPTAHLMEEEWATLVRAGNMKTDFPCICTLSIPPVQLTGLVAPSWFLYRFSGWIGCCALAFQNYEYLNIGAVPVLSGSGFPLSQWLRSWHLGAFYHNGGTTLSLLPLSTNSFDQILMNSILEPPVFW